MGERVRLTDYCSVTVTFWGSALAVWLSVCNILLAAHFLFRPPPGILLSLTLRLSFPITLGFSCHQWLPNLYWSSLETLLCSSLWPPSYLSSVNSLATLYHNSRACRTLLVFGTTRPYPLCWPHFSLHLLLYFFISLCSWILVHFRATLFMFSVLPKLLWVITGSKRFKLCCLQVYKPVIVNSHPNLVYSSYVLFSVKAVLINIFFLQSIDFNHLSTFL